jgi:hypothetical protein
VVVDPKGIILPTDPILPPAPKPVCVPLNTTPTTITCSDIIPGATCVPTPVGADGKVTCTENIPGSIVFPAKASITDPSGKVITTDPIPKPSLCLPDPNAIACPTGDADGDGSPNSVEIGDVNGDGIADALQSNVVTVENTSGVKSTLVFEGVGTCSTPESTFSTTEGSQLAQDPNYAFPWGLDGLKVKCAGTTKVTAIWPTLTKSDLSIYRKAGNQVPRDNTTFGYYDLPKVDLMVNNFNAVQYLLTDGLKGDSTAKDGYIYDPAGPAKAVITPTPTPIPGCTNITDCDEDGVPDAIDVAPKDACIPLKSAGKCDLDKDGKINSFDNDDDGDGVGDFDELNAGTDPHDPASKPTTPTPTNCTPTTPCYTGCNSTCSNMPAVVQPASGCCSNSGCCNNGGGISNITNTNTVNVTGNTNSVTPVYDFNNIFNSPINFTTGQMNYNFSPVTNNYK